MCGIFGQIASSPADSRCSSEIRHRGPDDAGAAFFELPALSLWVSLFHRRLSIIDLSESGHQPMSNEDGTVWITFNGEIYNFRSLRPELAAAGHIFRSQTDTEIIVHGYEQLGYEIVSRLHGMFAFALWDQGRKRLLLVTDRLGKKPLFYARSHRSLIFASEIKSILKAGVPAELDPVALHDYLTYLYFPYPATAFKHIRKMPPATIMELQLLPDGEWRERTWRYWDPAETAGSPLRLSEPAAVEQARTLLQDAVSMRLISDVPLGFFLSGGLDSSTITALASQQGSRKVQTFSIGFANSPFYDELPLAAQVARKLGTDHHVLRATEDSARHLTTVVRHFDEPFGNPTAILEYILTRCMREHVTVAISGDGGDELFGGYVRYQGAALARSYRRLPQFLTRELLPRAASYLHDAVDGRHGFRRAREFMESAWRSEEEMYIRWVGYFSESEKRSLYTDSFSAQVGARDSGDFLRDIFKRGAKLDPLSRLGYVDIASFLVCNCLEYADRMSMANSLEIRAPFTDSRLVEFALQLPNHMKLRNRSGKWITREIMRGILPPEVLSGRKIGFNPPMPQWLNGELKPVVRELLSPKVVEQRGIFRPAGVTSLLREHEEGRRDHGLKLWALMMIEVWLRMYFDHQSEESIHESVFIANAGPHAREAVA